MTVEPGASAQVTLRVLTERRQASAFDADPGGDAVHWDDVRVTAQDRRLDRTVERGLDDLRHLILRDPASPGDVFAAAGSPWYLTLFGRDSLWTARMLLPFGTELAEGTLRTLARRQGTATDARTGEAPGKIPHELRRHVYRDRTSGMTLPQVYYGTVDATALWVCLLAEACDWGLPLERAALLAPALEAAVEWLTGAGQPDGDGLLKISTRRAPAWPTRAGRTPATRSAGATARSPTPPSPSSRPRRMPSRRCAARRVSLVARARRRRRAGGRGCRSRCTRARPLLGRHRRGPPPRPRSRRRGPGRRRARVHMGHVLGTSTLTPAEARSVADTIRVPRLLTTSACAPSAPATAA